uniref:Transmembrane protein n=1 Tax=Cacopsylla melanoneura TaxID=428564 RepID=A0A8D8RKA5_9HEMI
MISYLIRSSLITPQLHLIILISATSILFSCVFFTAHVSAPYSIAGLTVVRRGVINFSFQSKAHSSITQYSSHLFLIHPGCIHSYVLFQNKALLLYLGIVDPRYLNFSTVFSSFPPKCIFSSLLEKFDCKVINVEIYAKF